MRTVRVSRNLEIFGRIAAAICSFIRRARRAPLFPPRGDTRQNAGERRKIMRKASHIERTILESHFGETRYVKAHFEVGERRTRDFAIAIRVSVIGHHRPFGMIVSRGPDAAAPSDELELRMLIGRDDVRLFGSTRVGEEEQLLSDRIDVYSTTGKDYGDFDLPPLASFYLEEVHDFLPAKEPAENRFAQYFFCAPLSVWPGSSAIALVLEGDGKFITEGQAYRYQARNAPISLEVSPFSRYPEDPNSRQLGPELFREPYADDKTLGEHSAQLILNAPQASLLVKSTDTDLSDDEFVAHCDRLTTSLRLAFSFITGARCYWHMRAMTTSEGCRVTHAHNGDWRAPVEYEARHYPIRPDDDAAFLEHIVEQALSGPDYPQRIRGPVETYLACLAPANMRDRFTLACLALEDLSKDHKEWLIPQADWRAFVAAMVERFPAIGEEQRIRSGLAHLAQSKFAQRMRAWADAINLKHDDLDPGDPFGPIVAARNKIVHGSGDGELSDDEIRLELAKALTLLERYVFCAIGWTGEQRIRPLNNAHIRRNRMAKTSPDVR